MSEGELSHLHTDTIAAVATPPGFGGVGIVRISGPLSLSIAKKIVGFAPNPRHAHYTPFLNEHNESIDQGLVLYFPAPNSFTGEEVVELQGHGGPVVLDLLLKATVHFGARLARPGEFSERAFLNDKMDLSQAEAISDLIHATTEQSARSALRSLQGAFSQRIHQLVDKLTTLRIYVEAAIDFPEEEIDFLADSHVDNSLKSLEQDFIHIIQQANQGSILREGMHVVIAGKPNAGKSSLLNALTEKNSAIVTNIEGTTRDTLHEYIQIDGIPLHITDTAGLRDTSDIVEKEGIKRALTEVEKADLILLVVDCQEANHLQAEKYCRSLIEETNHKIPVVVIHNKIDVLKRQPFVDKEDDLSTIYLSAKTGDGVQLLKHHLKALMGVDGQLETSFTARARHIDALNRAKASLDNGVNQLRSLGAGELLAEDLKMAQKYLGEITGDLSSDDLLGKIFSSFCIGK